MILKVSYFWGAQSWMRSTLFYCWGAAQVGSYRTGPPEWRMLGYPPTWLARPRSCHASSCIPLQKRKESVEVEINTLWYFILFMYSFILFKKVSITVKEVCIHITQFKMISKKNCLFLSKCLLELHVGFNETIEFSTWSMLVTCWLCNALTLSQRDLYFFLRWQLVFHDPETDQPQKKNKLLHKLCVTELETSSV